MRMVRSTRSKAPGQRSAAFFGHYSLYVGNPYLDSLFDIPAGSEFLSGGLVRRSRSVCTAPKTSARHLHGKLQPIA